MLSEGSTLNEPKLNGVNHSLSIVKRIGALNKANPMGLIWEALIE